MKEESYRCKALKVMILALLSVCISVTNGQEANQLEDELQSKHITSPTIEGSDFKHNGDMTIFLGRYDEDDVAEEAGGRFERNVVTHPRARWPNGVVPYEISSVFSSQQRQLILDSMRHWEDNTCVRFRPKQPNDIYSIYIMRDSGCYSFVGRLPSSYQPQGVSLGNGCVFNSVVIHELGHAIGFYHEHTRPDRDNFIDVLYGNIAPGLEDQFEKFLPGETNTLGLGYDLNSIMHYSRNTFSRDGSDTIRPKNPSISSFGNARRLSTLDIAKANRFYNCAPPPTTPPPPPPCGGVLRSASGSFRSPNWPISYPVNINCEWRIVLPNMNKLVEIKCEDQPFGIAGRLPDCTKDHLTFYDGNSKQADSFGPYCDVTSPNTVTMSSHLAMAVFLAGPSHNPSRRGFRCTYDSVDRPTTPPPTTPPPPPCGGVLNTASGSFQTPNWPETYPVNVDCEWRIELPNTNKLVEIRCEEEPFGIAGTLPNCDKDHLTFYDGHSRQDDSFGPYCYLTNPDTVTMSSHLAMAVFLAGPSHSPSRKGFRCTYKSVDRPTTPPPTTPPPTTPPPPVCGGVLNTASGSFQTPNWPETYPVSVDCEWRIELPDEDKVVEIRCEEEPFGIAGRLPDCTKDHLTFYDGHTRQADSFGPYCDVTSPNTVTMSSNLAMAVFLAGPSHSPSRRGFRCTYKSADGPTTPPPTTPPPTTPPPTTPPPTTPPPPVCGGVLNTASGSFQTPNWPETYPVSVDCEWRIELPDEDKVIEIRCEDEPFGIAGRLPDCTKDHLTFYDGHSKQDDSFGPYCYFTNPDTVTMSSHMAMAVFHAGPSHSPSRKGFRCTYHSATKSVPPLPVSSSSPPPPPTSSSSPPPTTTLLPTSPSSTLPPPPPGGCPTRTVPPANGGMYQCDAFILYDNYFGIPGFPNLVNASTPVDCDWTLIALDSGRLRITYFDLPSSTDCSTHSLTIYDGVNDSADQMVKLCGEICEERIIPLNGQFMFLKFHMESVGAFRGFQAILEDDP